jgi:hypothetical protein
MTLVDFLVSKYRDALDANGTPDAKSVAALKQFNEFANAYTNKNRVTAHKVLDNNVGLMLSGAMVSISPNASNATGATTKQALGSDYVQVSGNPTGEAMDMQKEDKDEDKTALKGEENLAKEGEYRRRPWGN